MGWNLQDLLALRLLTLLNPGLGGSVLRLIKWILIVIAVFAGYFYFQDREREKEILNATPMVLGIDSQTGYLSFDVNIHSGFGSNEFLSAIREKPVVLTGGIPVTITIFEPPEVSDSDDKNIKKITFGTREVVGYLKEECVNQIAEANRVIYEKIASLPKAGCTASWCGYATNPQFLNPDLYKNHACEGFAVATDIAPECKIQISGELKRSLSKASSDLNEADACHKKQSFIYTLKGSSLSRSRELEALNFREKEKALVVQEKPTALVVEDEFACLVNPGQDQKFCYECSSPNSEMGRLVCSSSELRRLDLILNASYKTRLALSSDPEQMKADQAEWVLAVQQCSDEMCAREAFQSRISELSNKYR